MIVHQLIQTKLYWEFDWEIEKKIAFYLDTKKWDVWRAKFQWPRTWQWWNLEAIAQSTIIFATFTYKEDMMERANSWLQLIPHCYF